MAEFSFKDAFAEAGDLSDNVLPEGEYEMRVKSVKADQTAGGKQCFKVVLESTGGTTKGKTVPDQLTWSPESEVAARIFSQTLRKLGAPMEWIQQNNPGPDQIAERMVGAVIMCGMTQDEWQGAPRNRVRYNKTVSFGGNAGGGSTGGNTRPAGQTLTGGVAPVSLSDAPSAPAETPGAATQAAAASVATADAPPAPTDGSEDPWAAFRAEEPAAAQQNWP